MSLRSKGSSRCPWLTSAMFIRRILASCRGRRQDPVVDLERAMGTRRSVLADDQVRGMAAGANVGNLRFVTSGSSKSVLQNNDLRSVSLLSSQLFIYQSQGTAQCNRRASSSCYSASRSRTSQTGTQKISSGRRYCRRLLRMRPRRCSAQAKSEDSIKVAVRRGTENRGRRRNGDPAPECCLCRSLPAERGI